MLLLPTMQEITPQTNDFRLYLQSVLLSRSKRNPCYSLRAFALNLELNPSTLSQLLRGKRPISPKMRGHLACRLGMTPKQIQHFDQGGEYDQLSMDVFEVSSDWHYFAILELMLLKNFRPDPKWVAKSLSLKVSVVDEAIERLVRMGFLAIDDKDGTWIDKTSGSTTTIGHEFITAAHKKLQKQILEKAIDAVDMIDADRRDQTAMTVATNSKRLTEAKKMITKFRRKLCAFLEQDVERDQVYQFSISLFPLTQNENERKNECEKEQ